MNILIFSGRIKISFLMLFILSKPDFVICQEENLNLLNNWIEWSDGKNMLIHHLNKQAFEYLDTRDREIAELKTKEDWINRQKKVKDVLMKIVGPFPEKTPLNPRVTGVVQKKGFRIEKVIYESMPGFYVTSCLFIPDGIVGKRPAIIHVSGHLFQSFRSPESQKQIFNLVRKGFIVFAIDPLCQGERIQYWDDNKKSSMMGGSPSGEHRYIGNQMFISGVSPGRYFIWDGIRGVDYLITRKEVDNERIGIFGCSGGGTQTTYISAFDERIKSAAPACYITGFRRLLESTGADDPEQNFFHSLKYGISQEDLLELRAPRPLLISSTSRDFFSIQGAIETYNEVRVCYKAFGREENVGQVIDDAEHGFNKNITEIYAFFQKTLDLPGSSSEENFEGFTPEELKVTTTGQISTSLGGESAFNINKKDALQLISGIQVSRNNIKEHLIRIPEYAKKLSGYLAPESEVKYVYRGRYQREGYGVEMYVLQGEGNYVIPLLLFVPEKGTNLSGVLYINPKGKSADSSSGGEIEQLVKNGYLVAAPDLLGTGEVRSDNFFIWNCNISVLTGQSLIGIQAGDIIRVVNFLKNRKDINPMNIAAIAYDELCPTLLHAAAFDNSIKSITLYASPISYKSIVVNRFYDLSLTNYIVAGSLTLYDLPDLIGCIAPRKIALIGLKDQIREEATKELIDEELSFPRSVYSMKSVPENFKIFPLSENKRSVIEWCLDN